MKPVIFDAITYESHTAKSIDLDLPSSSSAVELIVRAARPVDLFGVSPEGAFPLGHGRTITLHQRLMGITSLRISAADEKSCLICYRIVCRPFASGDKADPIPVAAHVSMPASNDTFSAAIQAMVRQQLHAAGINPDGDLRQFADGDLSFDDDDDDYGPGSYDDDDDLELAQPDPPPPPSETPAAAPSKSSPASTQEPQEADEAS